MTSEAQLQPAIRFYWRPGCPFCSVLRFRLGRHHLAMEEINIWDDPEAAAFVRSVAGGNETVPTVAIGEVALVNPSAGAVVQAVLESLAVSGTAVGETGADGVVAGTAAAIAETGSTPT